MKKNVRTFFVRTVRALLGDCRHVFLVSTILWNMVYDCLESDNLKSCLRAQLIIFSALQ